jgi:hypothetical protein
MLRRLLFLCLLSFHTQAELYRCEASSGQIQFTDKPCPATGNIYQPKAVMTNYKTIKLPKQQRNESPTKNQQQCPFLTSTEIRNLRVKEQFKKGLTQEHIQQRLGKADNINNNKDKSTWVYAGKHVKRIFRFKHSCLISWKEKWKDKESQISKFRDER